MSGFRGHLAGAVTLNTVYVTGLQLAPGDLLVKTNGILSDWQFVAGLYVLAMLFGLWPDVDTNSKGQNIFFGIAFVADILLIATGRLEAAAYLGLLAMTPIVGRHRGWTHSKWAMIAVPLPIIIVPYINKSTILATAMLIYGAAVVGYFSHLLLDGLITKRIKFRGRESW